MNTETLKEAVGHWLVIEGDETEDELMEAYEWLYGRHPKE